MNPIIARMPREHIISLCNGCPDLSEAEFLGIEKYNNESGDRCIDLKFKMQNGEIFRLSLCPS